MEIFWNITSNILIIVYVYLIVTSICTIIMEYRNPVKTLAWIVVLLLVPVVGFIFYIFFGRNFRKQFVISRRSLEKKKIKKNEIISTLKDNNIPFGGQNLATLALNTCDAEVYPNNKIKIFTNGVDLYDDIIPALENAKSHIHLDYYIFLSDEIGNKIIDILISKAKAGIEVKVIIDDVGSWEMKKAAVKRMKDAGIMLYCFLKVGLPFLNSKVNYRNHRKILVIDGQIGYTGGINIADRYVKGLKWGPWRDSHIRFEGSAVAGLQKIFLSDWFFVSRNLLTDEKYYPAPTITGKSLMQIITSGPDSQWESIMQIYFMTITQAQNYVYIETPYFIPNETLTMALQTAALSGIDVRLILPNKSDAKLILLGSYSYINDMLKAGVKVYFYSQGFIHSKAIVIDDHICTIGSANLDFRSFEQNFELNALVYDKDIATEMKDIFMRDLEASVKINKEEWNKRSTSQKIKENLARLISPLF